MAPPNKKRKTFAETHHPEKPSAKFKPTSSALPSIAVALPGSILLNAQSDQLKALLASQIARLCAIFCVSEIVVFHEEASLAVNTPRNTKGKYRKSASEEIDSDVHLARILEYLETPQYLRRALIPMHPSLRLAGILPPLDMPHHVRKQDTCKFREGVTLPSEDQSCQVDIGLDSPLTISTTSLPPPNTRVTIDTEQNKIVPPSSPLSEGLFWGYAVRLAPSLAAALVPPAPSKAYDLLIGLSERGINIDNLPPPSTFPKYTKALIVLGGLAGLELTVEKEKDALGLEADQAGDLFDYWVNVCVDQGSRTIRTEEALGIGLSTLRERLRAAGR